MKKQFILILFLLTSFSSMMSFANTSFPEGFMGTQEGIFTVETVLDAGLFSDGTPVILTGFILTSLGNEFYTFEDNTGSVIVEIGSDKWFGLLITDQTKITIRGTINFEFHEKTVMVDSVRLSQ